MEQYGRAIRWIAVLLVVAMGGCAEDVRIVEGPYVFPEAADRVVVIWETELPGDSWVEYGLTTSYGVRVGSDTPVQSHRVPLSGLRAGRRYFYRVSSAGSRREGRFTAGVQFVKGPYSQNVTSSGIVLMWETEPAAEGRVAYGSAGAASDTVRAEGSGGLREVVVSGLQPGTDYRYRVFAEGLSSPEGAFRTPAPADTAFRFLLYGDSRSHPDVHGGLVAQMAGQSFDFVLHSGDFVDDGQKEDQWGVQFFDPVRPLALRGPIYPALGNHEYDAPTYYRLFAVPQSGSTDRPEAWYAFDYENAHFIVLDSNPASGRFAPGSEQLRWLEEELKGSDAQWTFVMFHHPLYSSGRHKSDEALREVLMPLFERYGVDMVLTGHDHLYERTWPLRGGERRDDGIVHIVSGGGGAELYPVGRSAWTAVAESCTHYCVIQISGSQLDLDVFDLDGRQVDALTVHKHRPTLERLLEAVGGTDPAGRLEAVRELGRTGRLEAAPAIVPLAETGEAELRRAVAEALARIGSRDGMAALVALSGDPDVTVRQWAMQGLIDLGGARVAGICLERLEDPDPRVRRTAARGLRRSPLSRAVAALANASRDRDAGVRLEAVLALAATPGTAAGDALVEALRDADPAVREGAFEGVVEKKYLRPAVPALIELLGRESGRIRREIVSALGKAGDRTAVPALIPHLKDEDVATRQAAAIALARLEDPKATEALILALDDPDRRVRTYVMRALGVITGEFPGNDPEAWKRWWQRRAPLP